MAWSGEIQSVYLRPGELFVSREPAIVCTVLGSCLAVTMFSPEARMGAICHGLLPSCTEEKCSLGCRGEFRYVNCSIKYMIDLFKVNGVRRNEIEVKLFGGADMFSPGAGGRSGTVGRQNISAAMKIVQNEGLRIIKSDLGGIEGRKLVFHIHTGEVFLKRVKGQERGSPGKGPDR